VHFSLVGEPASVFILADKTSQDLSSSAFFSFSLKKKEKETK